MGFSRQETGVGCHFLLQWIFKTQRSNCVFFLKNTMKAFFFQSTCNYFFKQPLSYSDINTCYVAWTCILHIKHTHFVLGIQFGLRHHEDLLRHQGHCTRSKCGDFWSRLHPCFLPSHLITAFWKYSKIKEPL